MANIKDSSPVNGHKKRFSATNKTKTQKPETRKKKIFTTRFRRFRDFFSEFENDFIAVLRRRGRHEQATLPAIDDDDMQERKALLAKSSSPQMRFIEGIFSVLRPIPPLRIPPRSRRNAGLFVFNELKIESRAGSVSPSSLLAFIALSSSSSRGPQPNRKGKTNFCFQVRVAGSSFSSSSPPRLLA